LPAQRGKGYGRAIVGAVVDVFNAMQVERIRLFVAEGNDEMIPFYENLGFSVKRDIYMALL